MLCKTGEKAKYERCQMTLEQPTIAQKSRGWHWNELCNLAAVIVWLAKQVSPSAIACEDESAKSFPRRSSFHTSLQLVMQLSALGTPRQAIYVDRHSVYDLMSSRRSTQQTFKQLVLHGHGCQDTLLIICPAGSTTDEQSACLATLTAEYIPTKTSHKTMEHLCLV